MIELDDNFGLENLSNELKTKFEDVQYNKTRVSSYGGDLIFTPNKMYFFVAPPDPNERHPLDFGGAPKSWCIDINEIAAYGKYGLGGFKITLNDGQDIRFTNVFRKLRNNIIAAIEERKK